MVLIGLRDLTGCGGVGTRAWSLEAFASTQDVSYLASANVCDVPVIQQGRSVAQFVPQVLNDDVASSWLPSSLFFMCDDDSFGFREFPVMVGLMLFNELVYTPLGPLLSLGVNVISRKFEFQADAFACSLGKSDPLQTGLVKVSNDSFSIEFMIRFSFLIGL